MRSLKHYRLNRLFHPVSGRCFDVAVDHGMPGEPGFLTGIEDMEAALVLGTDTANVYAPAIRRRRGRR